MNKEITKIIIWRFITAIICLPLSIWMFNEERVFAGILLITVFIVAFLDAIITIIGYRKRNRKK